MDACSRKMKFLVVPEPSADTQYAQHQQLKDPD